jgi:hypothetical protein
MGMTQSTKHDETMSLHARGLRRLHGEDKKKTMITHSFVANFEARNRGFFARAHKAADATTQSDQNRMEKKNTRKSIDGKSESENESESDCHGASDQIIPTVVAATKEGEFDRAQCARVMGLIISPSG